jgi:hypothetical protein
LLCEWRALEAKLSEPHGHRYAGNPQLGGDGDLGEPLLHVQFAEELLDRPTVAQGHQFLCMGPVWCIAQHPLHSA